MSNLISWHSEKNIFRRHDLRGQLTVPQILGIRKKEASWINYQVQMA